MKNFLPLFFLILIFCGTLSLSAQKRIKIDDPDYHLSLKKPRDWFVHDDGYVLKIFASSDSNTVNQLQFTYFAVLEQEVLESAVLVETKVTLPELYPGFELKSEEPTEFLGEKAVLIHFVCDQGMGQSVVCLKDQQRVHARYLVESTSNESISTRFQKIVESIRMKRL